MFLIAETTGCFIADIEERMSLDEFAEWGCWFGLKQEEEKRAIAKAKRGSRGTKHR